MDILLIALTAALNMLLVVLLNPVFLIVAIFIGIVAFLALVVKLAWAIVLWGEVKTILTNAYEDFKADPLALIVIGFICAVNLTVGLIVAGAYFVAGRLHITIPKL